MNKYPQQPDRVIDLHGHTLAEAECVLRQFLEGEGPSRVRIIVGKGTHSKAGPVLREFVKNYLAARNIRFSQSKIQDGGEGALEVYF